MKEKITDLLKLVILVGTMNIGLFTLYCFVWALVGLPLTEWAMCLNIAIATITELAYLRWVAR